MRRQNEERRASVRVAIRPGSNLQAAMLIEGENYPARAGNLSASGIFVHPSGNAPRLPVGDSIEVNIKFEGQDLRLSGIVCYRRDGGYGVHFPLKDKKGYQNPLDSLALIANALMRKTVTPHRANFRLPGSEP